jgi:hypothetical protein
MEIKILCACGTKFKFDVEPVNGRMPGAVNCPACGADATEQANEVIRSALYPPAEPLAAAPSAPAPASVGLRINRPAAPAPEEPVPAVGGEAPLPRAMPRRAAPVRREPAEKSPVIRVVSTLLIVGLICFGAWRFGSKWYKRVDLMAKVASAVGEASVDSDEPEGAKNLWYEKCAALFIKHTNHLEVAQACQDYWKAKLRKKLLLLDSEGDYMNPGEYELIPAHNGYVRILGAFEWPVPQHEGLARELSQKFGTLVFEWRTESFADTYHFGVYDHGARKFHAQMDVKITGDDVQEIVTTEGNEFATANGYKPGPEGFKEFHVLEADKITQRLGMKLWDEKEGTEVKPMLFKEAAN